MTDAGELFRRAAPTPRGEVSVEELARRSRRRRRGRRQMGAGLFVLLLLAGVLTFSTRGGSRSDRVATEQPPVSTATSVAGPAGISELWTVQMVSPITVFAGGPGRIIRSDDGGRTWRQQPITCTSCPGTLHVADIDMVDSTTGWAATSLGLLRTTDGEHWAQQPTGQEHEPSIVQFVSRDEGWILTSPWGAGEFIGQLNAVLSHTTDGGNTWTHVTSVPADVQSVCFASRDDGWLTTRHEIYRSVDAGSTWQLSLDAPVVPLPDRGVAGIRCARDGGSFAEFAPGGGDNDTAPWALYSTTDGGQHWTPLMASGAQLQADTGAPRNEDAYSVVFTVVDTNIAFVAPYTPKAQSLAGAFVAGGRTVEPFVTITNKDAQFTPLSVSFADPAHGVLVGDAGPTRASIYFTSDGGHTWTPSAPVGNSPTTEAIEDPVPVLQRTVTGVDPMLLPTAVPPDWKVQTVAEANGFTVSWYGPQGQRLTLAVVVPNPPPIGPDGHESSPDFRGDRASVYFDYGQTNPAARQRILMWTEPGTWVVEQRGGVPYELTSEGITEDVFFAIAGSLQRVGP